MMLSGHRAVILRLESWIVIQMVFYTNKVNVDSRCMHALICA